MTTTAFTVAGMTCEHCVRSVTEEVSEVPGVSDVAVDLDTGALTITSTAPIDPDALSAAVTEAGYQLVAP